MSSYQNSSSSSASPGMSAADSKKEEFRKYLEKTHALESLTKVLVGLYEEPDKSGINAVDYLKKHLGGGGGSMNVDVDALRKENEDLKNQVDKLTKQVAELQANKKLGRLEL